MFGSCTICTDYFDTENDISVTPCGHLFHAVCLNQWIETCNAQRTCPQCRRSITAKRIIGKLYINIPEIDSSQVDPFVLRNKVDELEGFLKKCKKEKHDIQTTLEAAIEAKDELIVKMKRLKADLKQEQNNNRLLKIDMETLKIEVTHTKSLSDELKQIKLRLKTLENIEVCINGQKNEVDEMLQQYFHSSSSQQSKQLATFCVALKQEYETIKDSRNKLNLELMKLKRELHKKEQLLITKIADVGSLEKQINTLQQTEETLNKENLSLKQKLKSLQLAITSPSDTRTAVINRLLSESPAPEFLSPVSRATFKKVKYPQATNCGFAVSKLQLGSSFSDEIELIDDNISNDENTPPLYVPETPETKCDNCSNSLRSSENNFIIKNTTNKTSSLQPSTSLDDPQFIRKKLLSLKIPYNSRRGHDGLGGSKRRSIQRSLVVSSSSKKFSSTNTISLKKTLLLKNSKQINTNRFSRLKRSDSK